MFTQETATISLKEANEEGMKIAKILSKMPKGSTYEFKVPHYLTSYKNETLNTALISWVKDEEILKKDSYLNHVIPHQLAHYGDGAEKMQPYSSLIFRVEIIDII